MKILAKIGLVSIIFLSLFAASGQAQTDTDKAEIEALKKHIEEIQKENQRRIEELQKESQQQIESLKEKIEQLEVEREEDHTKIKKLEVDKETDDKKIEQIVTKKLETLSPVWARIKFNPDFPTYWRTRAHLFNDATFVGASPGGDDDIFFVDSRLLLSPMIEVSENLSLRSQLDITQNLIWGGTGDESVSDKFTEAPSPGDSFRGAFLREVTNTFTGETFPPVDEDIDPVDIRSLYMVAKTPIGDFYVGRQPYDWGLGIFVNAGGMPDQDLGSIVDRFEFDTAPLSLIDERFKNWIFAFSVDRLSEGQTIANSAEGDGWEAGTGTLYLGEKLTLGGYIFLVNQRGFNLTGGLLGDLDDTINWSLYGQYDFDPFFVSFEFQDLFGEINDLDQPLPVILGSNEIDISAENFLVAARLGYDPPFRFVDKFVAEFGWASGDDATTPDKLEGNAIFFNNAYTVDNLLFKHIIPNIYALEGSVINSGYLRAWATLKLTDSLSFTPQALVAWVDERNALLLDPVTPLPKVERFLGTELEGTVTWKILDHLWFDLIGSLVISGGGLDDLISQRALIEGAVSSLEEADPSEVPFAFQGRFIFTLDPIIQTWSGSSSLKTRAWFHDQTF